MTVEPTGEVHPLADRFPMLPEDELALLAEDIRLHGLQEPCVLDPNGMLLDGRNRLAGCRRAGVEPHFRVYDGNAVSFIISANAHRRHLSKGQLAMAVTEGEAGEAAKKLDSLRELGNQLGMSHERVRQARAIRCYRPDLVDAVLLGTTGIDEAYTRALERKREGESDAQKLARQQACLAALRALDREDLALLVDDGQLAVPAAEAQIADMKRLRREREQLATRQSAEALRWIEYALATPALRAEFRGYYQPELSDAKDRVTRPRLLALADRLQALAEEWD